MHWRVREEKGEINVNFLNEPTVYVAQIDAQASFVYHL